MKQVYLSIASDFVHPGILNVLQTASSLGEVTVGILSDDVIASYKRAPMLSLNARKEIFSSLKGVDHVVEQNTMSYEHNLRSLKPDYVVHGDDWRTGVQSKVREEVIDLLSEWGGQLVEVPYTIGVSSTGLEHELEAVWGSPSSRRGAIRRLLKVKPYLRIIEASNGLSGLIAENAMIEDPDNGRIKSFDGMWVSSLCDSTFKGKPDIELVDFTSRVNTIEEIMEVTTKPIILDGDTGGRPEHFARNVSTLERLGVSAVIIEDKEGAKRNSLFGTDAQQILADPQEFAEKIAMGKAALKSQELMIIARIESLIAGSTMEDALNRASIYVDEGGADAIMIHSKNKDGGEVIEFLRTFKEAYPSVPIVVVPTSYNQFTEDELASEGASIIIYANHLLRAAYPAMRNVALSILEHGRSLESDSSLLSISEVLSIIPNR